MVADADEVWVEVAAGVAVELGGGGSGVPLLVQAVIAKHAAAKASAATRGFTESVCQL